MSVNPRVGHFREKMRELIGIDIRSLALFRIALSLVLLGDLFARLQDLRAFYTDSGLVPRELLITKLTHPWEISIHMVSGIWQVQLFFFLVAIFFAVTLLIGYKTRLSALISWLFLISLQSRNPVILQGGDIVLRLLLFWGLFLPLGSAFSIDQKRNKLSFPKQFSSLASFGLLLQVCFIYWFTALLKTDSSWRSEGSAIWYALHVEQFTKPLGFFLLQFPDFLRILTLVVFYFEAFGPFLAFSPIWTGPLRLLTALLFLLFHLLGLNLTMELGHFCYICAVAWLVFIPGWFWDKIAKWKKEESVYEPKISLWNQGLALFFIGYIFLWNIGTLRPSSSFLPEKAKTIGLLTRTDQYWNMFSPYPLKEDGWFVIPAQLRDGSKVDLFTNGGVVSFEKPSQLIVDTYKSDRFRSYMMNLFLGEDNETHLLYYGRYLTREWNQTHSYEKQVLSFNIYFMLKITHPQGVTIPEKILLWEHSCF